MHYFDSGTEMPIIDQNVVSGMNLQEVGCVNMQGVTGAPVLAKLVVLPMRLRMVENRLGNK